MLRAVILVIPLAAMLAACASPQQQQRTRLARMAERTLDRMEVEAPRADPGLVAATDIAFARAARDTDQWAAFRKYAADGAVLHAPAGVGGVLELVPEGTPPAKAMRWAPNSVWSSCNGRLAVSFGKFQTLNGRTGTYATVWQRERSRDIPYKWTFSTGAIDNPQPAPRETLSGEDVIIVQELSSINARTADCPRPDITPPPPPPTEPSAEAASHGAVISDDRTLQYRWEHHQNGTRVLIVQYLRGGAWEDVVHLVANRDGTLPP